MNTIDAILYINLDHRQDRKKHIEKEISRMEFDPKIVHRISAIYDRMCGHLGCGLSHIKALEVALQNKWQRVMILEDDFKFLVRSAELHASIKEADCIKITRLCATDGCTYATHTNISNNNGKYCCKLCQESTNHGPLCEHMPPQRKWDVLLLAQGHNNLGPLNGRIRKVNACTTTSGYIVKANYIETLLKNFRAAVKKMQKQIETRNTELLQEGKPLTKFIHGVAAIDQEWAALQKRDIFYIFDPMIGTQLPFKSDTF